MKKKLALALSVLMIIMSFSGVTAVSNGVTVVFNDEVLAFDQQPEILNGTTMVPIRIVSEKMGGVVDWDEKTQSVGIRIDDLEIMLTIGSKAVTVNGEEKTLLTAPYIKNGRTMVPIRFISENMGADVSWDQETETVTIKFDGIILNKITADYPIIVIPGTFGTLSQDQFELLGDIADMSMDDSFMQILMSALVPIVEAALEKVAVAKTGVGEYYMTETDGVEYYVEPFIDTYVPLFKMLEKNGLKYNEDYFIFGYESLRNPIDESVDTFSKYVEEVLEKTDSDKVSIVAHSQGALIARDYIQTDSNYENIDKLMTLGAPYQGSAKAYGLVTGAEFGSNSMYDLALSLLSYIKYGKSDAETKLVFADQYLKAVYDMQPIYDDCYSDVKNTFLEDLNNSRATKKLEKLGAENVINIIGIGTATDDVYDENGFVKTEEGDGTVAVRSAELGEQFKTVKLKGYSHAEYFITDSKIYDYFDLD